MPSDIIRPGKLVALTYTIWDEQGQILERSDLPMSYIHGGKVELVGGMDRVVDGHRVGEEVEFTLEPEAGFGPHDPSLTFTDDLANVPEEFRFVGAEVPMESEAGEVRTFYVTRIAQGRLTVDGNHPFAGKTLRVKVKIVEVRDPNPHELAQDGAAAAPSRMTH